MRFQYSFGKGLKMETGATPVLPTRCPVNSPNAED